VNQSLAWVAAWRLARGESVVSNSNDHGFLLSMGAHVPVDEARLRAALEPGGFMNDLETVLRGTDTLGRKFRNVAETGQLIPKRSYKGPVNKKYSSWNGSLLYQTLMTYEPDHVLVRETVREIFEDLLDAPRALVEARRLHEAPWEWFEHPRPSPFALPLFAAFNRDVLLAGDVHRAFDEMAAAVYAEWEPVRAV
jgi:ATP-dependent Lhr-like helicase